MVHVPGRYPARILSRLVHQAPLCNQFQSCKSEIIVNLPTGAAIQAAGGSAVFQILDTYRVFPYTTLEFVWSIGVPTLSTPYSCPITVTAGMSESQVAAASRIGFDNWRALHAPTFKVFREMQIQSLDVDTDPKSRIYLPYGILGNPIISYVSTVEGLTITYGNPGVDNPILSGLWGPQRFAYPVRPVYRNPYYGEVPIG